MNIFNDQCPLPSLHGAAVRTPYPRGFDWEAHHARLSATSRHGVCDWRGLNHG